MKIRFKRKRIKIIGLFSIILILIIDLNLKKDNNTVNYEYTNIQLDGVVDNNTTMILNEKQNTIENEIKLNINFFTTQDLLFNTVLINNFKNVKFSFNELKSSALQKIKFPKLKEVSSNVVLRTENKGIRLNDYILFFIDTKNDMIDIIKHKRFTLKNTDKKLDLVIEPIYIENIYEKTKNLELKNIENLAILDYKFSEIETNSSVRDEFKNKKTYFCIDIEKEINNSPYFDSFIKDTNAKNKIPINLVIFFIEENTCQVIDESIFYIKTELNKKILIENPNLYELDKCEDFRIMAVFYPLSGSEDKLFTYKVSIWESLFYSKVF